MTEDIAQPATEPTDAAVPDEPSAASTPLPEVTTVTSQLTPEMKLELAALKCVAHYGSAEAVRPHLTSDTLMFFNAWHANELPKYWDEYFSANRAVTDANSAAASA